MTSHTNIWPLIVLLIVLNLLRMRRGTLARLPITIEVKVIRINVLWVKRKKILILGHLTKQSR
jgi:hypothetical protein